MSDLLFNVRFGSRQFQVSRDGSISWFQNLSHLVQKQRRGSRWFEVYAAFGKKFV